MPFPADYHMHTPLCRHATGEPAEYAAAAVRAGLCEIGFSDHNPMRVDRFDSWRMLLSELDEYVAKVQEARRAQPGLCIKLAMEVDYQPGGEEWVRDLAGRHPWDYLIGSVHYIEPTFAVDDPSAIGQWKERETYEVWEAYFERLTMAAESGLFDIIGHADLCKKFGFYPQRDCGAMFTRFLSAASRSGVAMELNTAGLRKDCREIYPSPRMVRMAAEMRVPITFGSDAHAPEEVGMAFGQAVALARAAGHTHWCRFTGRAREAVRIEG